MEKKREPIDELIDALVWMQRRNKAADSQLAKDRPRSDSKRVAMKRAAAPKLSGR
jgi:hypothetical protein